MSISRMLKAQPGPETPTSVEFAQRRHEFLISDNLLLSPDLMAEYSDHWVAAQGGKVRAAHKSLDALLDVLKDLDIPLVATAIRFIEKDGMAAP